MLGCLIADYLSPSKSSGDGVVILLATCDILLTKLVFEDWRVEENSNELYESRFDCFLEPLDHDIDLCSWAFISTIPIGLGAKTLDAAQEEARRCARVMTSDLSTRLECEMLASFIFLGKEGVSKEAIPYFLKEEYDIELTQFKTMFAQALCDLLDHHDFTSYFNEARLSDCVQYQMICGALGQVFYPKLNGEWTDLTLDAMNPDFKVMALSFLKTFNCMPAWDSNR